MTLSMTKHVMAIMVCCHCYNIIIVTTAANSGEKLKMRSMLYVKWQMSTGLARKPLH